jgi:MEMO1 family protein
MRKISWSALCLYVAFSLIILYPAPSASTERIRKPAVAGYFYPNDKKKLRETVDDFIANAAVHQIDGKILGVISPHAGYVFSGGTAAYSYKHILGKHYDTVLIIGPSHHVYLKGASVGNWDAYMTPLGKAGVNKEIVNALLDKKEYFHFVEEAHIQEHSVETQIPFLQRVLTNFDIVPVLMGRPSLNDCRQISDIILEAVKGKDVLFVASTDMSHYPDYDNANKVDQNTLSLIEKCDPALLFDSEAKALKGRVSNLSTTLCGLGPVATVMMAVKKLGGNSSKILRYANSGDTTVNGRQERRRVVGYGAAAFYKK